MLRVTAFVSLLLLVGAQKDPVSATTSLRHVPSGPMTNSQPLPLAKQRQQQRRRQRLGAAAANRAAAQAACAGVTDPTDRENCVFDLLLSDDIEMASAWYFQERI
jgi:hypothetical protein